MVKWQVFLKREGGDISPISFFQGLSFLDFEITLPFAKLCYAKKVIFFCHHNFIKKRSF